jgi:hypothetical protein
MKKLKLLLLVIGVGLGSIMFNSCSDESGYSLDDFWMDIVTIVPIDDNTFYLRMDDGTTLWPAASNVPFYKPKENQRALVNFTILSDSVEGFKYDHWIRINRIDEILTKNIAEDLGNDNDSIYGTDPVEIVAIWTGDNYLNVYFKTYFGGTRKHYINLIPSSDENAMFEFRHNAYDDPETFKQGSFVSFNLDSLDTFIEDNIITVKINTYEGEKVYEIKFAPLTKGYNVKYINDNNDVFYEGLE